ncbi:MAG: hypothetical protein HUU03_09785 [Planctomycetaceae bacterium]|nr:hypothetical protein [Planctomycetaceae bacterium]
MKPLFLLAMALPLAALGCSDQRETEALRAELARTKTELSDAREEARLDQARLQERLARLEARLGREGTAGQRSVQEELSALKAEMAKAASGEEKAELEKRIAAVEARVENVKTEAMDEARKGQGGSVVDEQRIAEMAAKKLAEEQAANAPTKNFAQAIARLSASEAEKQAVKDEILKSKKDILELLEVPTAEGRNFGEEVIDAFIASQMGAEGAQAKLLNLFADLANTRVPGDAENRSYAQALEDIKKKNRQTIGRILSPDDQKKLDRAHADWTDFEGLEGDPFTDFYLQRLKKYQDANKK